MATQSLFHVPVLVIIQMFVLLQCLFCSCFGCVFFFFLLISVAVKSKKLEIIRVSWANYMWWKRKFCAGLLNIQQTQMFTQQSKKHTKVHDPWINQTFYFHQCYISGPHYFLEMKSKNLSLSAHMLTCQSCLDLFLDVLLKQNYFPVIFLWMQICASKKEVNSYG